MNFIAYSLVDITETGARRGEDPREYRQQQNYMSFLQTLSLRFNPIINRIEKQSINIDNIAFGSDYKKKHTVWVVKFSSESDIGMPIEEIAKDFEFVPIINELDETIDLSTPVFRTQDSALTNLILESDDK